MAPKKQPPPKRKAPKDDKRDDGEHTDDGDGSGEDSDAGSSSSSSSDDEDNTQEEKGAEEKKEDGADAETEGEEDEDEVRRKRKKKQQLEKKVAPAKIKPARLSAATLKTKMSPAMLQNPINRKKIWANLMKMMVRRGYEWVQDRPTPTDMEQLWPNNKNYLGQFHMHAVDKTGAQREPVYVIFCSKAGEPTLKSLQYPSKHIVLVSDSLTGRARAALQSLPLKTAAAASTASVSQEATSTKGIAAVAASASSISGTLAKSGAAAAGPTMYSLKDVLVEAFVSSAFMFDLLKQRYLRVVEFSPVANQELETVYDVFERKKDLAHFPRMLDSDPVVRHLRLPIGSVIKQKRLSTASAVHQSFRVIVRTSALEKQ